eukprot:3476825-Prymnesium_polylepis.1
MWHRLPVRHARFRIFSGAKQCGAPRGLWVPRVKRVQRRSARAAAKSEVCSPVRCPRLAVGGVCSRPLVFFVCCVAVTIPCHWACPRPPRLARAAAC